MTEFVVVGTPLSQQASSWRRAIWKAQVAAEASATANFWVHRLVEGHVAYFCPVLGVDIDNIVKPILDAMKGILYEDDRQIVHVQSIAIELADAPRIARARRDRRAALTNERFGGAVQGSPPIPRFPNRKRLAQP